MGLLPERSSAIEAFAHSSFENPIAAPSPNSPVVAPRPDGPVVASSLDVQTVAPSLNVQFPSPSLDVQFPSPSLDVQTAFGQSSLLWQQGCHDYLLVSREMIDATERYIAYNPKKWALMHGEGALHITEPLFSPRLDAGDYWKGVGNIALLSPEERLVSLRVSRQVASPRELSRLLAKMESAADKGWVVISGFISKGELAVRDMLCRKKGAKFIRVRPSCIPNARFRPESAYIDAFAENRYLEIGRGNDEVDFGRGACLDLNAEIIEIATSGEGMALYWKPSGPQVLA